MNIREVNIGDVVCIIPSHINMTDIPQGIGAGMLHAGPMLVRSVDYQFERVYVGLLKELGDDLIILPTRNSPWFVHIEHLERWKKKPRYKYNLPEWW